MTCLSRSTLSWPSVVLLLGLVIGNCLPAQAQPAPVIQTDSDFHLDSPKNGGTIQGVRPVLAWSRKKTTFRFHLRVSKARDLTAPIVDEVFPGQFTSFRIGEDLESSTKYYWQVLALAKPGTADPVYEPSNKIATFITGQAEAATPPADEEEEEEEAGIIQRLQSRGLRLGRTLLDTQKEKLKERQPATLSFLDTAGKGSVFNVDFAIAHAPVNSTGRAKPLHREGDWYFYFLPSLEGSLTSDESESADALRTRATYRIYNAPAKGRLFDNSAFLASFKHEASQSFDTQVLTGEFQFIPTKKNLHIGQARPVFGNSPNLRFRWQPVLGIDAGKAIRGGDGGTSEDTVVRLLARARGELIFRRLLGAPGAILFVDNSFYKLPLVDGDNEFNYLVAGLEFPVTDNLSLMLSYKVGEESPSFQKIEVFGGSLGFKF